MSPRPKMSETRRNDILSAAAVAIAERGLCETRISDVADVLGVSPALILYYFPTKATLLSEAMMHLDRLFYERVRGRLEKARTAEDRLVILIEESCPGHADAVGVPDTWALWPATWEMARHDQTLAEARARLDEAWRDQIVSIVEDGIASGEFAQVDAKDFSIQLAAMLDGLAIAAMLGDPTIDTNRMSAVARSFTRMMLKSGI
ncbi:MAG: TetR family transcriptional regulator C-terminal domain-containing protein [Actinobacteria bacterium]|nr:TetR family transcriptional regulator C-terminal domain-containing protein [Actinomycetota bacterium]MCI0543071.1 TetR family transcriptional regulator C-terminal domain-containing protein [Actinomycetota bacterium]